MTNNSKTVHFKQKMVMSEIVRRTKSIFFITFASAQNNKPVKRINLQNQEKKSKSKFTDLDISRKLLTLKEKYNK